MEDPLARATVTERYHETHEILTISALSLYGYTPYGLIWQACLTDHSRGSTVPAFASTASTTSTICKAGELFKGCNTKVAITEALI